MDLKEYYHSLKVRPITPRTDFVKKVADRCGVNEVSVYRWISGDAVPDKLKQQAVAEIAGIPVGELFPKTNRKKVTQ